MNHVKYRSEMQNKIQNVKKPLDLNNFITNITIIDIFELSTI